MNLNELAKEIHENSKAHGWWDEPRPFDELCALMISELSEALEEARAGRPMEYFWGCDYRISVDGIYAIKGHRSGHKPEGIAVEMADCAIRILDYLGSVECDIDREVSAIKPRRDVKDISTAFMDVTGLIADARATHYVKDPLSQKSVSYYLCCALRLTIKWFEDNDLDFEAIARRKHEYNKTRPYKHGKEF